MLKERMLALQREQEKIKSFAGRTYFVIPTTYQYYDEFQQSHESYSDGTEKVYTSVAGAITTMRARVNWSASPWGTGDTLYIMPGTYAENITSLAHGVNIIGIGHDIRDANNGVKIKPASGAPVDVGGIVNTYFENICFESADTSSAFDGGEVNNCYFKNCMFTGAAEATTAVKAFITTDLTMTTFDTCWFCNADYGFYANYTDAGDKCAYLLMKDCVITGCSAAGIYVHALLVGPHSIIRDTIISAGGQTLAIGIDDNAGILELSRCDITATDPVDGCRAANGCYGNGTLLSGSGA